MAIGHQRRQDVGFQRNCPINREICEDFAIQNIDACIDLTGTVCAFRRLLMKACDEAVRRRDRSIARSIRNSLQQQLCTRARPFCTSGFPASNKAYKVHVDPGVSVHQQKFRVQSGFGSCKRERTAGSHRRRLHHHIDGETKDHLTVIGCPNLIAEAPGQQGGLAKPVPRHFLQEVLDEGPSRHRQQGLRGSRRQLAKARPQPSDQNYCLGEHRLSSTIAQIM